MDYYAELIDRVGDDRLRILLYHIPQTSGVGIPHGVVRTLHERFPAQVVGVKDSSGDWDHLAGLLEIEGLAVWPGKELTLIEALELGGQGAITASANVNPGPIAEVVRLWDAGDHAGARAAHEVVRRFRIALQSQPFIPAIKHLIAAATGDARWEMLRPPLRPIAAEEGAELAARLESDLGFRLAA